MIFEAKKLHVEKKMRYFFQVLILFFVGETIQEEVQILEERKALVDLISLLTSAGQSKEVTRKINQQENLENKNKTEDDITKKPNNSRIFIEDQLLDAIGQLEALVHEKESEEALLIKERRLVGNSSAADVDERVEEIDEDDTEINQKENKEKADERFNALEKALSVLLGDEPSEEKKLTTEEFTAVVNLDGFLKEEEKKVEKIENLVEKAVNLVDGAVTLREGVEKQLVGNNAYDDFYYNYYDYLDYFY